MSDKKRDQKALMQFDPPGKQLVETESGFELVESLGWIKFSAAFRYKMLKLLKGSKLSVFMCICCHLNESGESFPSVATIVEETGLDRDTVMIAITGLEAIPGLMAVIRKIGRVNRYRPAFVARGRHNRPVGKIRRVRPAGKTVPVGSPVPKIPTGFGKSSRENPYCKKTEEKRKRNEEEAKEIEARTITIKELYEENIGAATPLLMSMFRNAAIDYPAEWYKPAFEATVKSAKHRSWSFAETVLKGWKDNGVGWKPGKPVHQNDPGKAVPDDGQTFMRELEERRSRLSAEPKTHIEAES